MKDGINTPGARSNCATVPTYDKIRSAIRNPPRFEGKPTSAECGDGPVGGDDVGCGGPSVEDAHHVGNVNLIWPHRARLVWPHLW